MERSYQRVGISMILLFAFIRIFPASATQISEIKWLDLQRTAALNAGTGKSSGEVMKQWHHLHEGVFGLGSNGTKSSWSRDEAVILLKRTPEPKELLKMSHLLDIRSIRKWNDVLIVRSSRHRADQMIGLLKNKEYSGWIRSVEKLRKYGSSSFSGFSSSPAPKHVAAATPNDPLYKPYQWNLPAVGLPAAWRQEDGSSSVVVAVIDSGVDLHHPDLKTHFISGYNAVHPAKPPMDRIGHGTHVAGIIAAGVNNIRGVAGVAKNVSIMPVKVLDDQGNGDAYQVAKGIIWAADHGADVINLSLGDPHPSSLLEKAVRYAASKDILLVGAAGNNGIRQATFPAAYPQVINVAAADEQLSLAAYSNYGEEVDLTAPGSHIASTFLNRQYASLSGTSMASPHVAAIAALIRSQHPEWDAGRVTEQLFASAKPLNGNGTLSAEGTKKNSRDFRTGYGLVNALAALSVPAWPAKYRLSPGLIKWL